MKRLFQILKNKYFIAACIFSVWMIFFDRHDVTTQYEYYEQLKALESEKSFYENEIERINLSIQNLESNSVEIEKLAREKYQMKKDGEDVYVLIHEND